MPPSSIVHFWNCEEGMGMYPDKFFGLTICDIPYGIGVGTMAFLKEVNTTVKQKNGTRINPNNNKGRKGYEHQSWDDKPPTQSYFDELCRVSKAQIIFGIEYVDWEGVGPGRIKWDKGFSEGVSFKQYEVAYCSLIDHEIELPLLWAGMMQAKSLSEPMVQQGNKRLNEKRIHPCHKPVMLYRKLLQDYATPGDKILDTHLGGGSHRIAAYEMGFDFVAFENNKKHYDDQEKRFANYKLQGNLFTI